MCRLLNSVVTIQKLRPQRTGSKISEERNLPKLRQFYSCYTCDLNLVALSQKLLSAPSEQHPAIRTNAKFKSEPWRRTSSRRCWAGRWAPFLFSPFYLALARCSNFFHVSFCGADAAKCLRLPTRGAETSLVDGHESRPFLVNDNVVHTWPDRIDRGHGEIILLYDKTRRYCGKESRNYAVTPIIFVCTHNRSDGTSSLKVGWQRVQNLSGWRNVLQNYTNKTYVGNWQSNRWAGSKLCVAWPKHSSPTSMAGWIFAGQLPKVEWEISSARRGQGRGPKRPL